MDFNLFFSIKNPSIISYLVCFFYAAKDFFMFYSLSQDEQFNEWFFGCFSLVFFIN